MHIGHLIHFEEARSLGDLLVVTITADQHITKKRSVSFSEEYRARQVAALEIVDYVAIVDEPSAVTAIEALQPDVYVKGPEYADLMLDKTANISHEKALVESYGGRIHFTTGETFSSTQAVALPAGGARGGAGQSAAAQRPRAASGTSRRSASRSSSSSSFSRGRAALRVCLIGETIIDEWVDVDGRRTSRRSRAASPALETARVRQIGGAGIIALHLAGFVKRGRTASPTA